MGRASAVCFSNGSGGAERNSTVVFPMSIDIIKPFLDIVEKTGKPAGVNGGAHVPVATAAPLAT